MKRTALIATVGCVSSDMLHRAGCPCQCDRRLNGLGAHRIDWIAERADAAECVSRADVPEDDLVSLRRQLRQLHAAAGEHEEPLRVISFAEEKRAGRHGRRMPERDDRPQDVRRKASEQRYRG